MVACPLSLFPRPWPSGPLWCELLARGWAATLARRAVGAGYRHRLRRPPLADNRRDLVFLLGIDQHERLTAEAVEVLLEHAAGDEVAVGVDADPLDVQNERKFSAAGTGRSLVLLSAGNPQESPNIYLYGDAEINIVEFGDTSVLYKRTE